MEDFITHNIKFLAEWGQLASSAIGLLCIFIMVRLGSKNKFYLPRGFLAISGWLLGFVLFLLSSLIFLRISKVKSGVLAIIHPLEEIKGGQAPSTPLRSVPDDSLFQLKDYHGKVVLLNLWATWCPPCLREMPDLSQLASDYSDKGVAVIALSDESMDRITNYLDKRPFSGVVARTDHFDWAPMKSERPISFLLDRNGLVLDYFTGAYSYQFFSSQIEKALDQTNLK